MIIDISNAITGLVASFILGIIIGSFLNVCIYRLPLNKPLVFSRSKCVCCGKTLAGLDLLPIISYIVCRGKCRYCQKPISWRYPLVEFLSGFLFLLCYAKYGFSVHFFTTVILTSFLIVITFIDLDCLLILDKVLVWVAVTVFLLRILIDPPHFRELSDYLLAAALGGGFLFVIVLLTGGAMGLGDVKLVLPLGFWLGTKLTVLALFLAFFFGSVVGIILIGLKLKNRKDVLPFAPFISIGTFISMLYGEEITLWYLKIIGF